jgi:hypothetical protein
MDFAFNPVASKPNSSITIAANSFKTVVVVTAFTLKAVIVVIGSFVTGSFVTAIIVARPLILVIVVVVTSMHFACVLEVVVNRTFLIDFGNKGFDSFGVEVVIAAGEEVLVGFRAFETQVVTVAIVIGGVILINSKVNQSSIVAAITA